MAARHSPVLIGSPCPRVPRRAAYRPPDERLAPRFLAALHEMTAYAQVLRLRVYFYRFSSSSFGPDSQVMADLKRRWSLFQQSTVFRRIPAAIWVFGDHERPHIHLVAVLPRELTAHALRDRWDGGFTGGNMVRPDYTRLADYLAAQFKSVTGNRAQRQRRFGVRRLKCTGLAYRAPAAPPCTPPENRPFSCGEHGAESVFISPDPCADSSALAGERNGRSPQGVFSVPGRRQASNPEPSAEADGERPKAVGGAALPHPGLEPAAWTPPRGSEPQFFQILLLNTKPKSPRP